MQQIARFVRIMPSLYRLGGEFVYAWLQEGKDGGRREEAQELTALEIYECGGTFLYLRYPVESHQEFLAASVERLSKRPAMLFLENAGNYARHWKLWPWHIKDGRMEQSGMLAVCGFRIQVPQGSGVDVRQDGLCFRQLRFGREDTETCREGFFAWDGRFWFLVQGEAFWREAQIRYELDGYDSFTKRRLTVLCRTGEPQWGADASLDGIRAEISWNIIKRTSFICETKKEIQITGFPPIRMETLAFCFARGTEEYFPAPYGNGVFLADADAAVGKKGFLRIRRGDRAELVIGEEGYLGGRGLRAEASMLKVHAPFYAAGAEMEPCMPLPVFPSGADRAGLSAERVLDKRLQECCRLAYHREICFYGQTFEACVCGRELLWFDLYGAEQRTPGIALCRVKPALSGALLSDEFFVVLEDRDKELFAVPCTVDEARLESARRMGYPAEGCERLARCYPRGQIFLGEESFREGIAAAGCSCGRPLWEACQHFQVSESGGIFRFAPETWEEQGILLLVKKGRRHSVMELVREPQMWSLWSEEKETVRRTLVRACGEAQESIRERVLTRTEWEGSIVVYGKAKPDGQGAFLILPAGANRIFASQILEKPIIKKH